MKNKKKLFLLSLVQFILLLSLLGSIMYFKQTAKSFNIESMSIDPVEPLFGHYAQLSYEFDHITDKAWKGKSSPKENQTAFIVFKKGSNELYKFDYATDTRPKQKHSRYIKAEIQYIYNYKEDGSVELVIKHNLDQFYIPEKQMDKFNQPNQHYIVTLLQKNDRTIVKSIKMLK